MKKDPKLFYNKLKHGMRYNTYKSIKHTQEYSLTGTLMEIIKPFLNNGSMSSERQKISDTQVYDHTLLLRLGKYKRPTNIDFNGAIQNL